MWDTILEGLSNFLGTNRAALIGTVVVIAVSWVVIRITRRALKRWEDKVERDLTSSGRSTDRERGQRLITIS
ncbi:MAG: hypothetical protein KDB69_09315, partial [Acidimicrobiia bacterium]|nr:hypothetical protein [Acidimicrobiia bacterium]